MNGVAKDPQQDDHLQETLGGGDGAIAAGAKHLANADREEDAVKGCNAGDDDDLADMLERRGLKEVCLGNLGQDEGNPYGVPENVDPAGTRLKERPHELDLGNKSRAVDRGYGQGLRVE